jgi:hypothetical protein
MLLYLVLFSLRASAIVPDCRHLLRPAAIQAIKNYQATGRPWSNVENEIPPESHLVPASPEPNGHVIYLGAGMEVMRSLADFPRAKYFHLVGSGIAFYENVKGEISERLRHLPGRVQIDVVKEGYTHLLSQEMIEKVKHQNSISNDDDYDLFSEESFSAANPYEMRIRWTNASQYREFFVLLHPFTYDDPYIPRDKIWVTSFDELLKTIPEQEPLVGLMSLGCPAPVPAETKKLVDRLVVGGSIVAADYGNGDQDDPRKLMQQLLHFPNPRPAFLLQKTPELTFVSCTGTKSVKKFFVLSKFP